jgi:hypothetical protein
MNDRPTTEPESPETTVRETASATLADLADLARQLPGDPARNAAIADRLAEELAEVAQMLRSLPGRPAPMSTHDHQILIAIRAAHRSGEDVGETIARALARLASQLGSSAAVVANRPGSREAALVLDLLSGTIGPGDENLDLFGASS